MIKLYQFPVSGNSHKVRLMLSLLKLPHEVINVAGAKGEHKSPEFLAMNPFGQVPVLVDGDKVLRDSQAILFYLASQYGQGRWFPADPQEGARVVSWLTVAASEVSRGPGALRLHHLFGRALDVPAAEKLSAELLAVLNDHLSHDEWLVGDQISIADLAMYSYIALAPQAKLDLTPFAPIRAWLHRIQSLPGYVGMDGMFSA